MRNTRRIYLTIGAALMAVTFCFCGNIDERQEAIESGLDATRINTAGWEDSAFISLDGKRLYFMYSPLEPKQFHIDQKIVKVGPDRPGHHSSPADLVNMTGDIDIYMSTRDEYGNWSQPVSLGFSTIYDESCAMESRDGNEIWFTCIGIPEERYDFDIYLVRKQPDGRWREPVNIGPPVNTRGEPGENGVHEANPHVSPDGNTLYFEADHGYPGTEYFEGETWILGNAYDIYYSVTQADGSWGMPKNMGPNINTEDSEMQAWVGIDGFTGKKVIYFVRYTPTSEGYVENSVYHSEFKDGQWTKARKILIGDEKKPIEGEPSLTGDGRFLYIGKDVGPPDTWQLDIWFAKRRPDGSWGELKPVD